ncbi:MAG: V-type ATP synthase subunit C [Clostridiaceae bacterium]|nr:V-type ATP synthase subunit C [Clostridiaceae bacterium]
MGRIREEDYAYAAAHIRAIEMKLITENKMNRLLDMVNPEDAIKFLTESGYGADLPDSYKSLTGVEKLFDAEQKKAYNLLIDVLPDSQPVRLFQKRYDYLNTKLILKAEFLGIDVLERLSPLGTISPEKLLKYISERNYKELPEILAGAVEESLDAFSLTRDPQLIDFIVDRASYRNMLADAEDYGDPFLVELVKRLIDVSNIRVFIRAKILKQTSDFIGKVFISGGSIPDDSLKNLAESSLEDFLQNLKTYQLEKLSLRLLKVFEENKGISEVEKVLDDYIIEFLKSSKYVTLGIEPVIAYLFFKETEIKNARLILTGLVNRIPPETIKERLRMGYA